MNTLQIVVSGVSLGAIYSLIAIGVVIIIKASGLLNFAHGEMVMLGAVGAHILYVDWRVPLVIAFGLAVAITAGIGMLIERFAYRPLQARGRINVVLASVAVSLLLQNLVLRFWSEQAHAAPALFSEMPYVIGGFRFVPEDWATILAVLLCLVAFQALFTRTQIGLAMRAVMLDRQTASLMGINVPRSIANAFGVSAGLGAAAGILVAPLIQVQFSMGSILIKAFAGACLGGVYSIPGAILGGLTIGVAESLVAAFISSAYRDAIVNAILIGSLLLRPEGLLGRR